MVAIDSTFLGEEHAARELMQQTGTLPTPMLDSRAMLSVADLGQITAEPTDPGPGQSRGDLLTALDDDALDTLLNEPNALGSAYVRDAEAPPARYEPGRGRCVQSCLLTSGSCSAMCSVSIWKVE